MAYRARSLKLGRDGEPGSLALRIRMTGEAPEPSTSPETPTGQAGWALSQRAVGRRTGAIFFLGMVGAALFFGDGLITPAISVLSAVEGVRAAPEIGRHLAPYALPIAAGILVALFMVQARGTRGVAAFFGPIVAVWFLTLAGLGAWRLSENYGILWALS